MSEIVKYKSEEIVYIDESGIHEYLHRPYARSPKGVKIYGEVKGNKYHRISIIGAYCNNQCIAPFVHETTTDTKLFNGWVEKCLLPELKQGQVVVMDNYSIHKSIKTKELIQSVGCKILFLPPYSPDLNPIEKYWAKLKAKFRYFKPYCSDFNQTLRLAFK